MACSGSGITCTLILAVFITCFGSSLLSGYNTGVLNLPGDNVKNFLQQHIPGGPGIEFMYALLSALFVVAAAGGAFSSGWIAEAVGRRNALLINHIFAIVGAVLSGPCVVANSPALIYIGRIISGFNAGVTLGVTSLYLMEISPQGIRGAIAACHQLAVTIGILLSYVLTLTVTLNTPRLWPAAVGLSGVPAAISLFVLPFCPESPRFLYVKKGDEDAARRAFEKFNSKDDPDQFIEELREEMESAAKLPKFKFSQLFTSRDLRMAIALACLIQVQQQLSGINAVIAYSSTMLETAKLDPNNIQYCVVGIGAFNVVVTIISLPLLERVGRRPMLLWPAVVLAISLLVLTITVNLATNYEKAGDSNASATMGIVSTVFIFVYIGAFAIGLGPVPAMIVSEMFRQEPRAAAYSLSQAIQWLSNLIVLISYPSIDKAIGGYSFLIFLVIVVICWIVFFFFLPETGNRSFDEVARILARGRRVVCTKDSDEDDDVEFNGYDE